MNDYEEDLDGFPPENKEKPAESTVGSYRAESTDLCTARSGITAKIPPLFDGSTSWFKYEELIHEWLGLTVLEAEKRGPALKNRLVGDAELYKGPLNRESLRAQSVFLWRLYQFTRARRRRVEMVNWIGKLSLLLKRLKDSWMDVLPMSALTEGQRQNQYLADVAQENVERLARGETALNPNAPENRERWNSAQVNNHESLLSFSDNLTTLMFIVASDLSEAQRERLTSSLSLLRKWKNPSLHVSDTSTA